MPAIRSVTERRWPAQDISTISVDPVTGIVTVADTRFLKSNQLVLITKIGLEVGRFKVRTVFDESTFQLGPEDSPFSQVANPSDYDGGTLQIPEQLRSPLQAETITRAVYEEEPTIALRSVMVDWLGRFYGTDNPLPVQLSDGDVNIGTVNAQIEVSLDHRDGFPDPGDVHDSLRIGGGTYEADVNSSRELTVIDLGARDRLDTLHADLTSANTKLDTIHADLVAANLKLDTLHDDNLVIEGQLDDIESAIQEVDVSLGIIHDDITASNVFLSSIDGKVSTAANQVLEIGRLDTLHADNVTIEGKLDTLHADLVSSNTKLDTLHADLTSSNTKLDTLHTDNLTTQGKIDLTNTEIGATNETAPATDTGTSGLNGRLQRVAQRLTTLIGFYSSNFGSATGAIRTAAQVGNAAGAADFNAGTTSAQTLRTVLASDQASLFATEASLVKLTLTQASTTSGQSGPLVQGAATTSDPTYVTGQTNPLSLTLAGRLRTDVMGNVASATADSGNPVKTGGVVNINGTVFTTTHRVDTQMNASGSTYVDPTGRLASYSAFASFTAVANATDIFTITGSASKTIKIRRVVVSGTNTGNTNALVILLKRSTANSGGTSTTPSVVPHDSNDAAGSAVARAYTANPTLGTLVGNLEGKLVFLPTLASTNVSAGEEVLYGPNGPKPITLRGTGEVFAVNLNGVALLGTTVMNIAVDWTEE